MTAKQEVIQAIKQGNHTTKEIRDNVSYPSNTVATTLTHLKQEGQVNQLRYGVYEVPTTSWWDKVKSVFS